MTMLINLILFIAGISLLYISGASFIKGSSGTARIFKIRPIIVGAVIIAFATSAPEFFISLLAVIRKSKDLAIGNIVGSCIANIGLVLGISALFRPISVRLSILRRELPFLFGATIIMSLFCIDLRISRLEASALLALFVLFIFYCVKNARQSPEEEAAPQPGESLSKQKAFFYLAMGLIGLLVSARLIVSSAIVLARHFGISELVIGLTIVAIGTSLPELAASFIASVRGESDISIGNVIGSNIFNILGIVGVICLIRPVAIDPAAVRFSIPLLLIYTFALAPILKSGLRISRLEGLALLASYGFYLYLIFRI